MVGRTDAVSPLSRNQHMDIYLVLEARTSQSFQPFVSTILPSGRVMRNSPVSSYYSAIRGHSVSLDRLGDTAYFNVHQTVD